MAMSVNSVLLKSASGTCRTLVTLVVLVLGACASHSADERVSTRTSLSASKDVNPDINGRPSPIVVRIFQLHGDGDKSLRQGVVNFTRDTIALSQHSAEA